MKLTALETKLIIAPLRPDPALLFFLRLFLCDALFRQIEPVLLPFSDRPCSAIQLYRAFELFLYAAFACLIVLAWGMVERSSADLR
jgi:hypothetical protein